MPAVDVYRTPAARFVPACMHCSTSKWVECDETWMVWRCGVCGEEWDTDE